jgi:hypothetical protein
MGLLPWAQEVPSSNLGAPTTYSFIFNSLLHRASASETEWTAPLKTARKPGQGEQSPW